MKHDKSHLNKIKTYVCCFVLPTACKENSQMARPRGINVKIFLKLIILKRRRTVGKTMSHPFCQCQSEWKRCAKVGKS